MFHQLRIVTWTVVLLLIVPSAFGQTLSEKLRVLEPLIHKEWTGVMKSPDGSAEFNVVRRFDPIGNGNVIKSTQINRELNNSGEGFFYWDEGSKKIGFFFIENKGVFCQGFVSVENRTMTVEGRMTWPSPPPDPRVKPSYDFRNTFEIVSETEMVDRWFQNAFGPWLPGHVIVFKAGEKAGPADRKN